MRRSSLERKAKHKQKVEHHRDVYRNHFDELIELRIISTTGAISTTTAGGDDGEVNQTFGDEEFFNDICLISIQRDRVTVLKKFWFTRLFLALFVGLIVVYLASNWIRSHLAWTLVCTLASLSFLFYTAQPVITESLILLSGLGGIQVHKKYLFGASKSTFINSDKLLINEAITMQQVIFYLVAVPRRLESHIFEDKSLMNRPRLMTQSSIYDFNSDNCNSANDLTELNYLPTDENVPLIPLFQSTLPRLDCLRVIYRHLAILRTEHQKSLVFSTNKTGHKQANGFIKCSPSLVQPPSYIMDNMLPNKSRNNNPRENDKAKPDEVFVYSTTASLAVASKSSFQQ